MVKKLETLGFEEILNEYSDFRAISESSRCLMCDDAPCEEGCPALVRVGDFIRKIKTGDFIGAAKIIREDNVFGASCARICPTERLCQQNCTSNKIDRPIDIPGLQKFVCDYHLKSGLGKLEQSQSTGKKVAIIGAGPGGLAAAFELRKLGYDVTVYEANEYSAGMLRYGIPSYRLSRETIDAEVDFILSYGINIIFNHRINNIKELKKDYDAVFLSIGLEDEKGMDIPGKDLPGVYTALDFLNHKYIKDDLKLGSNIAVIGGGDVAMDCARTAIRMNNVKNVYIVYRRSAKEMPAQEQEKTDAEKEGIIIQNLLLPVAIEGNNKVEKLICNQIELGEPDASGRRKPIALTETRVEFKVDNVVFAIGQDAKEEFIKNNPEIKLNKKELIEVNPDTRETSVPGVFAGGDITGGTTAIEAIGDAKNAVIAIHKNLSRGN